MTPVPIADFFRRLVAPPPADNSTPPAPSKAARAAARGEHLAAKARAAAERSRRQAEKAAHREAQREARQELSDTAYGHYLRVRQWARSLGAPEDASLAHLWHADRDTIAHLRRSCDPMSGVRAAEYDAPSEELTRRLQRVVMGLRSHRGTELLVPEPPALGGFGVLKNGHRINEETLRWFAAAIALEDGGVLPQFRAAARRQLVWEIGGGWGGFAYAFKTLCPNVTYLITGIPETLLVAAVYLQTLFPRARCRFFGPAAADLWQGWEDVDFVFAPHSAWPALRPPPIALTLDMMALRRLDEARVNGLVQQAYESGSTYFYSQLPAAQAPEDARRVWEAIGRRYWMHPVPPRGIAGIAYPPPSAPDGYVHLVGWRRLRP